jgi:hypothetical protein
MKETDADDDDDDDYITTAHHIATAALAHLAPHGILTDPCEPYHCGADGAQFKGVFARNLYLLHRASPRMRYRRFLHANAYSIWMYDRESSRENGGGEEGGGGDGGDDDDDDDEWLSVAWTGPFVAPANASTQSSALDALVAELASCIS